MAWRILARHHFLEGVTITESANREDESERRFTATIRGYRNWRLTVGHGCALTKALDKAMEIRARIDGGDKDIFHTPNSWDIIQ